jgi:hypothetical protein
MDISRIISPNTDQYDMDIKPDPKVKPTYPDPNALIPDDNKVIPWI